MVARKKPAPVEIPRSYAEANALLVEYGRTERDLAKVEGRLAASVARITVRVETKAAPLKLRLQALADQIAAYADANRAELLEGDRKSHDMPAGRIGWRTNPPSVKIKSRVKIEEIVASILAMGLRRRFLRMKLDLNKEAMLEEPNREKATTIPGITILTDAETFFIEPVSAELAKDAA